MHTRSLCSRPRALLSTLPSPQPTPRPRGIRPAPERTPAPVRARVRMFVRCAGCGRELDLHEVRGEPVALCYRCK